MKKWVNIFYDHKDMVKSLEIAEIDVEILLNAHAKGDDYVRLTDCSLVLKDVYLVTVVEMEEPEEQNEENTLVIDLRTYPEEMRNQIREMWTQDPMMAYGGEDIG